jgi:hypothetical protein
MSFCLHPDLPQREAYRGHAGCAAGRIAFLSGKPLFGSNIAQGSSRIVTEALA